MSRNILVLWRWSEALASEGWDGHMSSVGGQMKAVRKGDRLFICATSEGELYLLGLLQVKKVVPESDSALQAEFGNYRAVCHNLGGPFKILPLRKRKWQLRFVNTAADRLNPKATLAMQVRNHRFLSDTSADMLTKMLGDDVALVQREQRFLEGQGRAAQTVRTVRSAALRISAKHHWGVRCYCCGFSFEEFYGRPGEGFAIIHHLNQLVNTEGHPCETSVEDVRVVCANCHYIIHREDPPLSIEDLRKRISKKWTNWSPEGVRPK